MIGAVLRASQACGLSDAARLSWEKDRLPNEAIASCIAKGVGISYVAPPRTLRAFPKAVRVRPKTAYGGSGMLRARWRDEDNGAIYEWDYLHGRVEAYDKRGRHIGEFDEATGARTSLPDLRKGVEP